MAISVPGITPTNKVVAATPTSTSAGNAYSSGGTAIPGEVGAWTRSGNALVQAGPGTAIVDRNPYTGYSYASDNYSQSGFSYSRCE